MVHVDVTAMIRLSCTRYGRESVIYVCLNSLPNGIILDWSKLKAFAGDKINVAEVVIPLSDRVENIVGKGENAGYQHFLLFPQCFQKPFFLGLLKVGIVC